MNKFHKSTKEMKYIKMQWKEKINAHQEKTYSSKEVMSERRLNKV